VFYRTGAVVSEPAESAIEHVFQTFSNPPWAGHGTSIPGTWRGDPSVSLNMVGGLEVFGVGMDLQLWHTMQTGMPEPNAWTAPEHVMGGDVAGSFRPTSPVAIKPIGGHTVGRNLDGRLEVFAQRQSDGKLLHIRQF